MHSTQIPHCPRPVQFGSWIASCTAPLLFLLAYSLLAGCNSADSDYPISGILLTEEPDGARTVLEVREALLGSEATEHEHSEHGHAEHLHEHAGHEDHDGHSEQEHTEQDHGHHQADHQADHMADHQVDSGHDSNASGEDPQQASAIPVGPAGPIEVVVVGKIGGLANPWQQTEPDFPFVAGEAKFFLADPSAVAEHQAEGHLHASGEDCAFCAAHAKDSSTQLAVVQFKDQQGQILPRDARQWLTLKGNETVVVHGQAQIVAGGLLVIDAVSLYVRR